MIKSRLFPIVAFFIAIHYMQIINACTTDQFPCNDGTTCIPIENRCDDHFDCKDESDEINCTLTQPCPEGTYKCETGECVNDQTECLLVTLMLPSSYSSEAELVSSFVLATTSSIFLSTTSSHHSYVSLTSPQYSQSETWLDASLPSTVMPLPSSFFAISSFTEKMSTFHVKSPSAFISSSHPIEPTKTYNSYQTSVIETTPIDHVMTTPTENDIADGGSNNLYLLLLLILLIPMTMFVVWRFKRKMRSCVYKVKRRNENYDATKNSRAVYSS